MTASTRQAELPFDPAPQLRPDESRQDNAERPAPAIQGAHDPPRLGEAVPVREPRDRPAMEPLLLTVREVEVALQLGRTRTYELVRSGVIPVLRVGRAVRVPREALNRWIDENCASPDGLRPRGAGVVDKGF